MAVIGGGNSSSRGLKNIVLLSVSSHFLIYIHTPARARGRAHRAFH